ncbi:TrmH family RNA methyltransferase [Herbivorax sp. ANBcel31]|uniref:TrmH family RNA methyltransferase n=1 Tax=Herbivorax sp. ANBcel31 TaxID=3069754 RepID=UPI0027B12B80|nr:TrmH family RNA methyltransferase [Herbivorax sp. ANBcel31]MDQ2088259.1 TrmH family RNA methyltransferase [Herbivorax sp. ANBcel31]
MAENKNQKLKKYNKNLNYSYTFGAFPTIELIKAKPDAVLKVLISTSFVDNPAYLKLSEDCGRLNVEIQVNDKLVNRLSPKDNCYVVGVFEKYVLTLSENESHVVLVNPSNMGNLGTIIRTILGFGINNMAIISPGVDIYDPKVIRASMGAIFNIDFQYFNSFEDYLNCFKHHNIFTFMLDGQCSLQDFDRYDSSLYSLVFGNEASGLESVFQSYGKSIRISHSEKIDSLNLPISIGIALYQFSKNKF